MKLLVILLAVVFLSYCEDKDKSKEDLNLSEKREVIISTLIPPQAYIIKEIVDGREIEVYNIIGPTDNMHTYTMGVKKAGKLIKSNIYFSLGIKHFGIEEKIEKLLKDNEVAVRSMSKGIEVILDAEDEGKGDREGDSEAKKEEHGDAEHEGEADVHGHGGGDTHVFLSLDNISILAENVYDEMVLIDRASKDIYKKNLDEFLRKVKRTKEDISKELEGLRGKSFLIYHPSLGYFAKEFGLKQVSMEFEGKPFGAKRLKEIMSFIKKHDIKGLIAQKGFSEKLAKLISERRSLLLLYINPLEEDVLENLKDISKKVKQAIDGE